MGHPVLRRQADTIEDPTSPDVRLLVRDMLETMADANGLGLAAPQVHVAKRLVIFHLPPSGNVQDNSEEMPVRVLVNPTVEALDDEREDGWEGCLSLPGLRGLVPRFQRVRYRGIRPNGEIVDTVAEGLHARVVQHECDHLDGILYPMRMTDLSTLSFESEMRHTADG